MKRFWGTESISRGTLMLIGITMSFSSAAKIPRETKVKEGHCQKVHISEGHECPMPPDLEDIVVFNEYLKSVAECFVDVDCNGTEKCCFDGCRTLCVSVKQRNQQLVRQEDQLTEQENQVARVSNKLEDGNAIYENVGRKKEIVNLKMNRRLDSEDERTFVKIWPTGVKRGLIGEIIERFERKGYSLVGMKLTKPNQNLLNKWLQVKKKTSKRDFTKQNSGPVVVMVWKGRGIISGVKNLIGLEDPSNAKPGTINGDYMFKGSRSIVEASDDSNEAEFEIKFWFTEEELVA